MDSNFSPDELPDGFSTIDPTTGSSASQRDSAQQLAKEEQRRGILEQALSAEALARLGTIKLVNPKKASAVESLVLSMAMSGKIDSRISENKLIEMLEGIGAKQSQPANINIHRKKYQFDSDDDDDDDDDLL